MDGAVEGFGHSAGLSPADRPVHRLHGAAETAGDEPATDGSA
jgi:hypothetical protein